MPGPLHGVKRFILWDFPRAGWQYDLLVALILAFIFLTPRDLFRDQPKPSSIVLLPSSEPGANVYWLGPELLASVPETERPVRSAALIRRRNGGKTNVLRVEPIFDTEKDVKGYMVFTTP